MSLVENLFYQTGNFKLSIPKWSFSDKVTALTGEVGSGKTTVLKVLCGLLSCPGLVWNFKGKNLASLPPPKRNLGVCFQDLCLFPHLTVKQNLIFAVKAKGLHFVSIQKEYNEVLRFLHLKEKQHRFIDDLSGGERQRLALARALVTRPDFLFLDEPFSHLDEKSRSEAKDLTLRIAKKYSIPILLISHNRSDIRDLAYEEFYLKKGYLYKAL